MEKFLVKGQILFLNTEEYTRHNAAHKSLLVIYLTITSSVFVPMTEWNILTEYNSIGQFP